MQHAALIVVDVQNDFCEGGALEVPGADAVVPLINRLMGSFETIVFTQDWHPSGHASFASRHPGRKPFEEIKLSYGRQTLWPDHCVQGTAGADFHPELDADRATVVIRKGFRRAVDSYSGFFENDRATVTGLEGLLRNLQVRQVYVCGLALDVCVRYTAADAKRLGFAVTVIEDACRALTEAGAAETKEAMRRSGIKISSMQHLFEPKPHRPG